MYPVRIPSGGSGTASQDTLTVAVLIADTTTPVTLAGGYEKQYVDLFMLQNTQELGTYRKTCTQW